MKEAEYDVKLAAFLANEGHYKVAITRAYYAMFYCAVALHLNEGRTYKSHKPIISGFAKHFTKTGIFPKGLHTYFARTFGMRSKASYDVSYKLGEPIALEIISWAENFFATTGQYLKDIL